MRRESLGELSVGEAVRYSINLDEALVFLEQDVPLRFPCFDGMWPFKVQPNNNERSRFANKASNAGLDGP